MNHLLPLLALLSLPFCTLAEETPGTPDTPAPTPRAGLRLPDRKQVAMQMVIRKLVLDRYDADNNLRLDGEERHRLMADAHAARKQQAIAFIRRFDVDADGSLSAEERASMKQAMEDKRPHHHAAQQEPRGNKRPHHHRRPHMGEKGRLIAILTRQLTMDAYDADKNGILDTAESTRLRADGSALYEARKAELLTRFDSDGDGRLSPAEQETAVNALRPRRPQSPPPPPHPRAAEGKHPMPPPHHKRNPIHRLLDTHFDLDIIRHLTQPLADDAELPPPPCNPSTPSTN